MHVCIGNLYVYLYIYIYIYICYPLRTTSDASKCVDVRVVDISPDLDMHNLSSLMISFNDLQLEKEIGVGSFGTVYKVRAGGYGRECAHRHK